MSSDVAPEDDTFPGALSGFEKTLICLASLRQHIPDSTACMMYICLMPQQSANLIYTLQLAIGWHATRVVFMECLRVPRYAVRLNLLQYL